MKECNVGIIGFGMQGRKYAEMIGKGDVAGMTLKAIATRSAVKQQEVENQFSDVDFYLDYHDLLKSRVVDAVIICVPHYYHAEVAAVALEEDVHVLVEKPLGVYAKQVKPLLELAKTKPNVTFAILFNQRAKPVYQKLNQLLADGEIGNIRSWSWTMSTVWRPQAYYDQSKWRATWSGEGGGVIINQGSHQIDLIQWLFGMPDSVYAHLKYASQRDIEVDDDATVMFTYDSGMSGVFSTKTHDYFGYDYLEVHGDKGKIYVHDSEKIVLRKLADKEQEWSKSIANDQITRMHNDPNQFKEKVIDFGDDSSNQYVTIFENFAEHIQNGISLIAPGEEGLHSVEMINAIYLADWTKQEVRIPVDPDDYYQRMQQYIEQHV
ncbi:Gfo/Idh/MocA family oxidoreductase [Gracilibacillus sp. YIM 98692]|uniref:Gfo/Idh/MocA family protein n=1 Tax=Gracilibacillus sp. YIM 98692 TaxID=2663532 RepID=UPI0013D4433A|nr:Gfo/Idh/MocA family oxidoreductase [Gracilibacillus sp. YIM 98692]